MNKVKVGFFSFTEVTDPKEHRAYNDWHLMDHVVENIALPGIVRGERWVSTPACTNARLLADPMLAPIHYVACYLMSEPIGRTMETFLDLGAQLNAVGRFHRHRKSHLGGPFLLVKAYAAQRALVSPESIPYRPTRGIFVTVSDVLDPAQQDAVARWYDEVHIPDMLTVKGVAGAWWFANQSESTSPAFGYDNPPGRTVRVYYLDEDPLEMVADLHEKLPQWQAAGRMYDLSKAINTLFAGPFQTIVPFSDDPFETES